MLSRLTINVRAIDVPSVSHFIMRIVRLPKEAEDDVLAVSTMRCDAIGEPFQLPIEVSPAIKARPSVTVHGVEIDFGDGFREDAVSMIEGTSGRV